MESVFIFFSNIILLSCWNIFFTTWFDSIKNAEIYFFQPIIQIKNLHRKQPINTCLTSVKYKACDVVFQEMNNITGKVALSAKNTSILYGTCRGFSSPVLSLYRKREVLNSIPGIKKKKKNYMGQELKH